MKYVIGLVAVAVVLAGLIIDRLGILGVVGVAYLMGFAVVVGAMLMPICPLPFKRDPGNTELTERVKLLEFQLAEEREVIAAMTGNLDPSDF